jgi:hypothetical protein
MLEGAALVQVHMEDASLHEASLVRAQLYKAHLEGAYLTWVNLESAHLSEANLEGASLDGAILRKADLSEANLKGADIRRADLCGADFMGAIVDGTTLLAVCGNDRVTDFTGVGLRAARVWPELRSALEANVRRYKWKRWYREHCLLGWPVRLFWAVSKYGTSTGRILSTFSILAFLFAGLYCVPGLVKGLYVVDDAPVSAVLVPFRALYFSVVTMTTLGFGDVTASTACDTTAALAFSITGHVVLTLQVLLGYVLLGALVTRLAVLFQEA